MVWLSTDSFADARSQRLGKRWKSAWVGASILRVVVTETVHEANRAHAGDEKVEVVWRQTEWYRWDPQSVARAQSSRHLNVDGGSEIRDDQFAGMLKPNRTQRQQKSCDQGHEPKQNWKSW